MHESTNLRYFRATGNFRDVKSRFRPDGRLCRWLLQELGLFKVWFIRRALPRTRVSTIREDHHGNWMPPGTGNMVFELSWGYGGLVCPCRKPL